MKKEEKKWDDVVKNNYETEMINIPDITTEWNKFEKVYFKKKRNYRLFFGLLLLAGIATTGYVLILVRSNTDSTGAPSGKLRNNFVVKGNAEILNLNILKNKAGAVGSISRSPKAVSVDDFIRVAGKKNIHKSVFIPMEVKYGGAELSEKNIRQSESVSSELSEKISGAEIGEKVSENQARIIPEEFNINDNRTIRFQDTAVLYSAGNDSQEWKIIIFSNNQVFLRPIYKGVNPEMGLYLQRKLGSDWHFGAGLGLGLLNAGIANYSNVYDYHKDTTNGLVIVDSTWGVLQQSIYVTIPVSLNYKITSAFGFAVGADMILPFHNRFEYHLHRFDRNKIVPNGNDTLPLTYVEKESVNTLLPSLRMNYKFVYSSGDLSISLGLRHMLLNGYRKLPLVGEVRSSPGISIVAGLSYQF